MNLAEDIEPVSSLKNHTANLIQKVQQTGQPLIITQHGKAAAVLQDIQSFQRTRDTLLLLKIAAQGDSDYRAGHTLSHRQAKKHFRKTLDGLAGDG